ncbi:MAG: ribose-5-phosphate isomerase [Candidatus Nealsonbacteria bacterium CG08_land_8_20_14_0_20_38_20]|uniref:Ribose-5-phosphate isomerase n=1 Tax=Candidatus Nealsonbacteria bacterium CG08_land_8_20_14_0_20_38_20 TaxID=1974705 RepID=A0A2H0YLI9_9BACT|nr:MAG: ribose-5-phosphate isomerase [Candidatus Nealsonbacteria bacterium CG08_land_8_20_14_0_20_38_20]
MIYLGADHRGFKTKEEIKKYLKKIGEPFEDLGNKVFDPNDDYPDFTEKVSEKISKNPKDKGILFCGSAIGITIFANKFKGVRAAQCFNEKMTELSRSHNDANVLCISADFLPLAKIKKIVKIWLETKFSQEERHKRRLAKIKKYDERKN